MRSSQFLGIFEPLAGMAPAAARGQKREEEKMDEHRYESWNTGPGGDLVKSMEIVYKRK